MKEFAVNYSFENVISSPKYPQSNTEAVHAIQTVQICLKKLRDRYHALLAYREVPLRNA